VFINEACTFPWSLPDGLFLIVLQYKLFTLFTITVFNNDKCKEIK